MVSITLLTKSRVMQENLKILLRYLVGSFWDQLVEFENFSSVHSLKVKYEQVFSVFLYNSYIPFFGIQCI